MKRGPEVAQSYICTLLLTKKVGEAQPLKHSMADLFKVRSWAMKAVEPDQSDAMARHLIGAWSLDVANFSRIQRKATAALFGQVLSVTYLEAEPYLPKSHDLDDSHFEN